MNLKRRGKYCYFIIYINPREKSRERKFIRDDPMVKTQLAGEIYSLENEALYIWSINLSVVELERLLK